MKKATRDEAHAFLRVCNTSFFTSSYEQEGIVIAQSRMVTAQEVRLYVLDLESQLLSLSMVLAEKLKSGSL